MQEQIQQLVGDAQKIVVVQADNPDADSLGSALALEHILGDLGKDVYLYCGVDIPTYLRYLENRLILPACCWWTAMLPPRGS
jgi:nanoRNase/pAp phosphatase (c-di-AMP/oligoRNAs hydrolase)